MRSIFLKYDLDITCRTLLREQMDRLDIPYRIQNSGEVEISEDLSTEAYEELAESLARYGIEIVDSQKSVLVERIKTCIDEMLEGGEARTEKISTYLSNRLHYSYGYLAKLFSETTYTTIENYIILRKVDFAKELIATTDLTLTEIAFRLNYSSVAHLSGQFKKTTGLTPTSFQRIFEKRKAHRLSKRQRQTTME